MGEVMRLDDRYRLLRVIGSGSEGIVYLAIQESTHRFLAVKEILKSTDCYSREGVEVWKRLHHQHLPEIVDLIETEDKVWIVMEYIEGTSLSGWVGEHGYPNRTLLFHWLVAICDTLEYLHGQEPPIIFGDLKPENIIIQKERPILVDLGSAFVLGSKAKRTGSLALETRIKEEEMRTDLLCLGRTLEEILPDKRDAFYTFARKALGKDVQPFQNIRDCRDYLNKMIRFSAMRFLTLILGALLLILSTRSISLQKNREQREGIYQEYQDWLDEALEDLIFSEEEYQYFLEMWGNVEANGRTSGENLMENRSDYARICYKVGLSCWYFGETWGGIPISKKWFQEILTLPGDLQRNSESYLKLAKWKEQVGIVAVTGESDTIFSQYYQELKLMKPPEETYFQLAFCREEILFFVHYMAELKEEGVGQEEVIALLDSAQKLLMEIQDERAHIQELKKDLKGLQGVLENTMQHIYRKDSYDEETKSSASADSTDMYNRYSGNGREE